MPHRLAPHVAKLEECSAECKADAYVMDFLGHLDFGRSCHCKGRELQVQKRAVQSAFAFFLMAEIKHINLHALNTPQEPPGQVRGGAHYLLKYSSSFATNCTMIFNKSLSYSVATLFAEKAFGITHGVLEQL